MKNKTTTYKWAYLPFVFSSAAILATQASAAPTASQQYYKDAQQVNKVNHEYVGGKTQLGFGVTDEGDVDVELNQVISESDNHSTGVGLWAGYDLQGDNTGILGRGAQVNHNWVARDKSGRATHVNKVFGAYDRNEDGHEKATVGYGRENQDIFWEGHVSKGLSGGKNKRTVGTGANQKTVTDRAYDWGVGGSVGKFLPDSNTRIRAGLDHEWSDKVGRGESDARNTTLSAGIEKFFQGTGHSVSLDVAGSKKSGGYDDGSDDTDVTGRLGYRYDFGGASIYQPDRRYRRVRVEVPGKAVPAYKTVPVYAKKTIRTPYKQLVKSTMELEGQTFFKLNSAKLIPSAQARLKQIAAQIRKSGYKGAIRITGNTCGLGDPKYDQILSEKRANAVKKFLIANGFNPDHLVARGLGKGHPKYPRTPDQDFKNRRVDIEYVSERKEYKTAFKTEQKTVQTGTRKVALPGKPGAPRVIWKTETIPTSPAWIKRALHNNIKHDRTVNTYTTTYGNDGELVSENNAPTANNDSGVTECNMPITINVLDNDTDPDGDALTITSFTQPANGVVTEGQNGTLIYTPNTDSCGLSDEFTYTISDGNGGESTATVTVSVNEPKDDTVNAADDSATTDEGEAVTIDVLANDDADAEITRIVSGPSNGIAEVVDGEIVYTPDAGFVGEDIFVYEVQDPNGNITTATVTVTVNETKTENSAPVAVNDSKTTGFNQPVILPTLSNDSDPDGDTLTIISVEDPANGTAVISGGSIIYTPNPGFIGTDTFDYTISDGNGGTATATETVVVLGPGNNPPKANNDSGKTECNTPITINVLDNDTDADGDALTITSFTQPSNGVVTRGPNGTLIYTPNTDSCGISDDFTYTISDGNGGKSTATVTISVDDPKNTAPVAVDDSATTEEGTPVTLNTLTNDSDPDGDTLTITSVEDPANGTAVISGGQIIYTPAPGFVGTDTFTYTISDGNGGTATATETVTVTAAPNKPPVAVNDKATAACSAITIDVLNNDSDPDGDALSIIAVGDASLGAAVVSGGTIVYTPSATCGKGNIGLDTFTYTISDGNGGTDTATVTVDVKGVKDTTDVNAEPDDVMIKEGETVTINVLANDAGTGLKIIAVDTPNKGTAKIVNNKIVYTANPGETGIDSFWYDIKGADGGFSAALIVVDIIEACSPHKKCN